MVEKQPVVEIYTDGAASPNPGPGGYGVVLLYGEHRKELSAGYRLTTNNRMELLAVIVGLESLKKSCIATVYSDSIYVVNAIEEKYVLRWRSNNWWRTRTQKAKNSDLWERFLVVYEKHSVKLKWVHGHSGITENERCDQLAVAASKSTDLLPDTGYEQSDKDTDTNRHTSVKYNITHTEPGEECRKCGTPLVKRTPKKRTRKPSQSYYFDWYLYCETCNTTYMVEDAKRQYE